ncbi:MAG: hypothetical protein RTV41_00985 [Candidatus Thorarchaeota archaeon]
MLGRRLILGTKPEVDPLEEMSSKRTQITSGTDIRWEDRVLGRPLARISFVSLLALAIGLSFPILVTVTAGIFLLFQYITPKMRERKEMSRLLQGPWVEVPESDVSYIVNPESIELKGLGGTRHTAGMDLGKASPTLLGNVGSLVRAIDSSHGFGLFVTMQPEKITRAMDEEKISNMLEGYLTALSKGELDAYLTRRSGLWAAHATIVGHMKDATQIDAFDSAVRGAIPEREWKRLNPNELRSRIIQHQIDRQERWFYAAGSELSEWLVQLRSELAAEVGSNVPGQFIAPIRSRPDDYRLGLTLNPDTLLTGPVAGLSHQDLESGTLLCGGIEKSRNHIVTLLTSELLKTGKRVIVVTGSESLSKLTSLTESSVHLELGRDLVMNPIDAEGQSRTEYVPLLISALQVVAAQDLIGAAELEIAITRAVSLGNATLADVRLTPEFEDPSSVPADGSNDRDQRPSRKSLAGMEAIRSLHMGPAARAFYGTQTVPTRRLADPSLTVVNVSLGSTGLDSFAWNLMCMKLAGLKPDPNMVIILDGAENMRIRNRRFMKHDSFSERLLKNLIDRGPLVLSLEHPADMAPGAIGVLASCVSLRLRESVDIKYAADLLGLNVMTTGMHTKVRISPRESSFLRIMDDDTALLVHDGTETCQPVKLDAAPDLETEQIGDMSQRIDKFVPEGSQTQSLYERTLLDRVAGDGRDLAVSVLKLLERYEPLTEEAVRRFVIANGDKPNPDVEGVLARLEHASMILRGHESHSGVSYSNYRITMKGSMALKQSDEVGASS